MKKLAMIGGPAGVGKTAVCKKLFGEISGCAWLDADWCWMVNPYPGKTDAQKGYAQGTFGRILDGYLQDDNTKIILFCWLMFADFMFELVTDPITVPGYELVKIVLTCDDDAAYLERMQRDGRRQEQICGRDTMEKYHSMDATVIDTSRLTIEETAERIRKIIEE